LSAPNPLRTTAIEPDLPCMVSLYRTAAA